MKNNIFNLIINDISKVYNYKNYKFLKNKRILITGANSGLGMNLALNYAKQEDRIDQKKYNIFRFSLHTYLHNKIIYVYIHYILRNNFIY